MFKFQTIVFLFLLPYMSFAVGYESGKAEHKKQTLDTAGYEKLIAQLAGRRSSFLDRGEMPQYIDGPTPKTAMIKLIARDYAGK